MIKSLRKKFIIVAMCSTLVVLAALMGIVNIVNYRGLIENADDITQVLAENGGKFKEGPEKNIENVKEERNEEKRDSYEKKIKRKPDGMSPETPFATRYFTVTLDKDGSVVSSNLGKIAAISQKEAEAYAKKIFRSRSTKGFKEIYRYRKDNSGNHVMIIFLDCRQDLDNFKTFAVTSVSVSTLGLVAVFILVVIFSKIVFRPVEESYQKQKQFITDASHEIKTPLTIIDANTEVLEMESGENQWTKSTRNQIERLSVLTQQLITLSRLDENENQVEKTVFNLSDAVYDSVQPFEALAQLQEKQIQLNLEENISFSGDEKSIRQMIGILLENAVKYSREKGCIYVSLKQKGKKICFEVANKAEGLTQGNYDILFERFYRMDSSRNSETGGMGIGLSVAKAIVTSHKGKITAFSEDGENFKVMVELK